MHARPALPEASCILHVRPIAAAASLWARLVRRSVVVKRCLCFSPPALTSLARLLEHFDTGEGWCAPMPSFDPSTFRVKGPAGTPNALPGSVPLNVPRSGA